MKKTLSLVIALAMILSMSVTVFAVEDQLPPDVGAASGEVETLEKLGWTEVTIAANDPDGCVYSYTAEDSGTITVYIAEIPAGIQGDIVVTNETTGEVKRLSKDGKGGYGVELTMAVSRGDKLEIQVTASKPTKLTWVSKFTYAHGSAQNPIELEWKWNEDYTEATATATVPVGTTYYAVKGAGMILTVNGEEYGKLIASANGLAVFSIKNDGKAPAKYNLHIAWPVGSYSNHDQLQLGTNVAQMDAGNLGYYYDWTAEEDGTLALELSGSTGFTYKVNNLTAGETGAVHASDGTPASLKVNVSAGDQLLVFLQTHLPSGDAPAGKVTVKASFEAKGSEEEVLRGDVDNNKKVNLRDALMLLQHVNGKTAAEMNLSAGDVDLNGKTNLRDVLVLLQYVNGKPFPT